MRRRHISSRQRDLACSTEPMQLEEEARKSVQACKDAHTTAEEVGEQDCSGVPGHGTREKQSLGQPVARQLIAISNVDGCM